MHENRRDIDLSIIVPMYNEAECILENIRKIHKVMEKSGIHYELVVVDDGSADDSCKILKKNSITLNIRIVSHETNMGYSEAIRTGLRSAKGDYVIHLDADLQYSPHDAVWLYQEAKRSKAPFVWGNSDKSCYSPFRQFLAKGKNILTQALFGISIQIDLSSIKCIKMSALKDFQYSERKEVIGLELLLHAIRNKHTIIPLPIKVREREQGTSSFRLRLVFEAIKNTVILYFNRSTTK